ncbi:uracil-DNA glycosylase [Legionella beliardensis]|uniref:Uracil-DNA glycosylase n=1 Tax=Legionella beliardensis TaxID=91822 RepID=A0A378HZG1_9GAMM|nr:uracil-DNA glycosylase [Legionella beliardensis]STX28319.1 uracil-DNA glycosylase [Legionella beliardensis]
MHHLIANTHPTWHAILEKSLACMDNDYLDQIQQQTDWLPGLEKLFAAFKWPLTNIQYILLGESPYPRAESANGYAFWDNAVNAIWSAKGLSKEVNRATSLRNFIKMLLLARGDLKPDDLSQDAIAKLNKTHYCQTAHDLFLTMLNKGFLLLNATLVLSQPVRLHAKQWRPFMASLLTQLADYNSSIQLILFGYFAAQVPETALFKGLRSEHPYNISFITNPEVLDFFRPLDLLNCYEQSKNRK